MFRRAPKKSNDTQVLCGTWGSRSASQDELKMAYGKSAMKNHPDKGGDPGKFEELAQANQFLVILKRDIYDRYGEDALKGGTHGSGGFSHNPFDNIFKPFSPRRQKRGEDVALALKVSLEELYNGTTKKLCLSRNVLCSRCKGKGSKSGVSAKCHGCQGRGMKITARQIGWGMLKS